MNIHGLNHQVLRGKLNFYRKERIRDFQHDSFGVPKCQKGLSALFSTESSRSEVGQLLVAGLVYNNIYARDPLFKIADGMIEKHAEHKKVLQLSTNNRISVEQVWKALAWHLSTG